MTTRATPVPTDGSHSASIAPAGLMALRAQDPSTRVLDVRTPGEFHTAHIAGGMNAWRSTGGEVTEAGDGCWSLERQVRLVAGMIVFLSIAASVFVPATRYVAGFVGAGLTFAALTDTCAMGMLLARLPYNRGPGCDIDAVVRQLTDA